MAFQHANMLATQVLVEVKAVKEDILHMIEEHQPGMNTPPEQDANSTTSDNLHAEILNLFQSMQDTLKVKSNKNNQNNSNNQNNRNNRNNSNNCNNSNNHNKTNKTNNSNNSNKRCSGVGGSEALYSLKYTKYLCYSKTPSDNPTKTLEIVVAKGYSASSVRYWI